MQFFGGGSSLTSVGPEASPAPAAPPGTGTGANAQVLYVFNRGGVCLLYREWHRPLRTLDPIQDQKLIAEKGNLGVPLLPGLGCSFYSFKTNTYKLNFLESPSGIKLILITHPRTGDQCDTLKHIYNLYVEYVVKNPLYAPGTPIKCDLFNKHLDQYVKTLI
ncbi:hypothetical protein ABZP36_016739 [Zizania latifolia]